MDSGVNRSESYVTSLALISSGGTPSRVYDSFSVNSSETAVIMNLEVLQEFRIFECLVNSGDDLMSVKLSNEKFDGLSVCDAKKEKFSLIVWEDFDHVIK